MDIDSVLKLILHGNQLKRTTRTGWTARGVPDPENAAAHSYGVIFIALVLSQIINEDIARDRLLVMATLHDLPESLTSDIPVPSWRFLPEGSQELAETAAMNQILTDLPFSKNLLPIWEEWRDGRSTEAKIVNDADRLERYLQAYLYELHTGNQQLSEFWERKEQFYLLESKQIYDEIRSLREHL